MMKQGKNISQKNRIRGLLQFWPGGSFFRKVFLVYVGIILAAMLILLFALGFNLSSIKYSQSLNTSDQILNAVEICLRDRVKGAISLQQQLFLEDGVWDYLMDKVDPARNDPDPYSQPDINQIINRVSYRMGLGFNGILVGSYSTGNIFQFSSSGMAVETNQFSRLVNEKRQLSEAVLFSSRTEGTSGNTFSLFVLLPLLSEDYREQIGCMAVVFNAMNIRHATMDYEEFQKGSILILDENGQLLYHSSSEYDLGQTIPDPVMPEILACITQKRSKVIRTGSTIYNCKYQKDSGTFLINEIPTASIWADVLVPLRTMLLVFGAALIMALIADFISTKMFARRLLPITNTINQVKEGNLTGFPIEKRYDDEIGYIYTELLRMCASLDEHIQTEYVYQLKEKEMELYMLQTQINPHFLYNTLEAIHMKLYIEGEEEASHMIYILSNYFRSAMKKEAVVSIREEIRDLEDYLELYKFRLGDRLSYEFTVDNEVLKYAILRHILQPLVENALKHGIEAKENDGKPGFISIKGYLNDHDICFEIIDDGNGISEERLSEIQKNLSDSGTFQDSIGIYNVNRRLKIVYGPEYCLSISGKEGEGAKVRIHFKALKKKELMEYVQTFDRG